MIAQQLSEKQFNFVNKGVIGLTKSNWL